MAIGVTVNSTATLQTGGALDWHGRPAHAVLPNGTVVLVWYAASAHAANDGELRIAFSDDYGDTWTANNTTLDGDAVTNFPMNPPVSAGEDAFEPWLYLMPNGDLVLHMWRYDYTVSNGGTYQSRSTDWGRTWTTPTGPVTFTGLLEAQMVKTYATDDHTTVRMPDGSYRLFAGGRVYNDPDQDPSSVVLMYTDDNGESWTRLATIVSAVLFSGHGTQEFGLEYLGDGHLRAIIRDQADLLTTYRSDSYDYGVTWTALEDIGADVGSVVIGRQRLKTLAHLKGYANWWRDRVMVMTGFVFTTPGAGHPRRNALWVSDDAGDTFEGPFYIDAQSHDSGYSTMWWDPTSDELVVVSYAGPSLNAADLKIYRVSITGIPSVPGVWVDWGNDGSFDATASSDGRLARMFPEPRGVVDEITSDVHRISWSYGGSADHVSSVNPGEATITVKNSTGKYNPENTSSTLYGFLKPGRRVWVGCNADGTFTAGTQDVYGLFAGYLRQVVPSVQDGATALADLICEDPLGRYSRIPAKVAAATTYSYRSLREAILDDIGEDLRDLASEVDTLPLASADSLNALSVLDEINRATGSRHWFDPADSKELWGAYTVVDRHHKLSSAADDTINGDDVQAISGYRLTDETVVNFQSVDVSQAQFGPGIATVWEYAEASFPLTTKRTIWAQFDDFVKDATLDYTNTGSTVTTALTNFGTTAKIELWSAGSSVVQNLTIEGRQVIRDSAEAVTAEDSASQSEYGKRSGGSISSTYSSTPALAQGLANYVVWKFKTPLARPAITQINEFAKMLPRRLYDVVELTIDRLHVTSARFEIIGISGYIQPGVEMGITWELQRTPNASALDLFNLNADVLDGTAVLAY